MHEHVELFGILVSLRSFLVHATLDLIVAFSLYSYKCDDFVINETSDVDDLRQVLKGEDDSCSETSLSTNPEETGSSKSHSQQETASVSSSDSGWEEPRPGRKLRPRKRTISSDSSEGVAKKKALRKVGRSTYYFYQ